jgi:MATE family multidrug resistance protein
MFALFLVAIPICVVSFYMAPILVATGEDPEIAAGAQAYGRWLLPCILGYAFMMPLIKFCQSQHIVLPLMCCAATAFLLQFPMCFLLITKLKLGYQGGPMSASILIVLNTGILSCDSHPNARNL